ncbi:MAG TPA: RNA polymerase sigma factor, partial [Nocardioides sp.]|nr:RNA polymerase sigma factor [Nocardioides sp.]
MGVDDTGWEAPAAVDGRTDAELLMAVGEADRGALHELFVRHEPWLAIRLSRRCADRAIVDTAVQDTFLSVWRKPTAWRGEGEVAAWLWGIAVRSMLHQLRPRANVVERLRTLRGSPMASPEEELLARVEHSDVGLAFARLSPELQAVLQATVLDGLTTREAAALLGIPSGTVK